MADRPPTPAFAGMLPASMARIDRTPRVRGCQTSASCHIAAPLRLQGDYKVIASESLL